MRCMHCSLGRVRGGLEGSGRFLKAVEAVGVELERLWPLALQLCECQKHRLLHGHSALQLGTLRWKYS